MKLRVGKQVYRTFDAAPLVYTIGGWTANRDVLLYFIDNKGETQEAYAHESQLLEVDPFAESFACILDKLKAFYELTREAGEEEQKIFISKIDDFIAKLEEELIRAYQNERKMK